MKKIATFDEYCSEISKLSLANIKRARALKDQYPQFAELDNQRRNNFLAMIRARKKDIVEK